MALHPRSVWLHYAPPSLTETAMTAHAAERGSPLTGEACSFEVFGRRLCGKRWGDPQGQPFIALHGWLDNANTFDALAPLLPELCIVALDFAGHGHSDHRPEGVHYMPLLDIQDVLAVADTLGWERFGLIGHSMGAAISSELAGLFPERVTRVILIDGMVHHQGGPADGNARNREAVLQMLAERKQPPTYESTEAMARRVTEATDQSIEAASALVARGHRRVGERFTWRTDPRIRFATPLRISSRQIDALMSATTAPTLLLVANQGDRWFRPGVERRAEHHAQLTIEHMDGPHHIHLEPAFVDEVGRRVRRFLQLD